MNLRNKIEDVLEATQLGADIQVDLDTLLASNLQEHPSQLLLKFACYSPSLFESAESKNRAVLANLARLVLLPT